MTATAPKRRTGWHFPWRGLLALAVVIGLVRVIFCAVLRVQTGSMEPTLHGDPASGDEILVFTPYYKAWSPERFDLAMFERPNNEDTQDLAAEKLNVKRVVGLPGESIRIDDGDVYVTLAGSIVEKRIAKTYSEFRPLLVRRFFERFGAEFESHFTFDPEEVRPEHDGITMIGGENKTHGAEIALASQAVALDDGWMDASGSDHPGELPEQDVLFDLEVMVKSSTACMNFSFNIGVNEFSFDIVPRAPGHDVSVTRTSDANPVEPFREQSREISAGSKHRLEFFFIDGQIGVAVDGRKALCEALTPTGGSIGAGRGVSHPKFSVWASDARLTKFEVWRDLHYTEPSGSKYAGRSSSYAIPEDSVFVLGDNSRDSVDSRFYGAVPLKSLKGLPFFIVGPKSRMGFVH